MIAPGQFRGRDPGAGVVGVVGGFHIFVWAS
jgi:hypothetical protein